MKTTSIIATAVALIVSIGAMYCWASFVTDSNLLVTSVLYIPFLGSLFMSILKLRKKSYKASLIYSVANYLFSSLIYYVALSQ